MFTKTVVVLAVAGLWVGVAPGAECSNNPSAVTPSATSETPRQDGPGAGMPDGIAEAPVATENAVARSSGGMTEGIKVHGHWTIEIRDPDGTLVRRREFENALDQPSGVPFLSAVLARQRVPGTWLVQLLGSGQFYPGACLHTNGGRAPCNITEDLPDTPSFSFWFKTLSVDTPMDPDDPNKGKLVFTGTAVAFYDGDIATVRSTSRFCDPSVAPADCGNGPFQAIFTATDVSPAVQVSAGQQILVTVVISFS